MEGKRAHKGFAPIVHSSRYFYSSYGELGMRMYRHAHEGFKLGRKIGMIESIDRRKDPERARVNDVLAMTQLYHPIDPAKLGRLGILPSSLRDAEVLSQLELFDRIKALDRDGAGISSYSKVINGGKLPLAMLAVLVDYSTTHRMEDRLDELVAHEANPVFRTFPSLADAEKSYHRQAYAGLRFHAPIAELFGYPLLAGDILTHAFHSLYPEIWKHVSSRLSEPEMQRKLELTQSIVRAQQRLLKDTLTGLGFDVSVTLRKEKHAGKLMRKVFRKMEEDFTLTDQFRLISALARSRGMDPVHTPEYLAALRPYISDSVSSFDLLQIHDLVALRVVLNKFHGRSLDDMDDERTEDIVRIASAQIQLVLNTARYLLSDRSIDGGLDYTADAKRKANGYRANHFDVSPSDGGSGLLKYEIQLKTSLWHAIAEEGYAAHFYYLGGDREYVDMIAGAASDIVGAMKNGKGLLSVSQPQISIYRDSI